MTTILAVDDDVHVLELLRRVLARPELEIRTTDSPADALAWVVNDDIAVLIMDHDMPTITGVQLASQARRLRPETVRILLTGQRDLQTAIDGINHGEIFRFISKPFDHAELRQTIVEAIARHEELAEWVGDRMRRQRELTLRSELEADYPGITRVERRDGTYEVRDPLLLAAKSGYQELVDALTRR